MNNSHTDIMDLFGSLKKHLLLLVLACGVTAFVGCGDKSKQSEMPQEDAHAKKLLQGIWLNEDDEDVAFRVQGDTIFYPDSTSQPVYFFIYSDTLVMKGANEVKYPIIKQAAHLFEFKNQSGDIVKLVKTSDKSYLKSFDQDKTVALNQNTLIKRDTIVSEGDNKYHLYVQVNPTTYKVFKSSINDDGVEVDNIYYDNIVNLNVYHGASKVFSHDFRKGDFDGKVPSAFLEQAILSDLIFYKIDASGIHYWAVLPQPDSSLSYQVEVVVSFAGRMKILKAGA